MSTELDIASAMQNIDLSTVETSFPLLATGIVSAQIQECEMRKDDKTDAKPYLWVKYSLVDAWKTVAHEGVESRTVPPGFPISERIYIGKYQKKDGSGEAWYGLDRIAKLREAVFGKAATGTHFVAAELLGQTVTIKLKFDPAPKNSKTGEVYGPQTSVDGYIRKGK